MILILERCAEFYSPLREKAIVAEKNKVKHFCTQNETEETWIHDIGSLKSKHYGTKN